MVALKVVLIILCLILYALIYAYVVLPLDTSIFVTEESSGKRIWLMIAIRIMWLLTTFKIIDFVDFLYERFIS